MIYVGVSASPRMYDRFVYIYEVLVSHTGANRDPSVRPTLQISGWTQLLRLQQRHVGSNQHDMLVKGLFFKQRTK